MTGTRKTKRKTKRKAQPAKAAPARRKKRAPRKLGRPSTYTAKIGLAICERMAGGESLRQVCADPKMPCRKTVMRWALKRPDFGAQYARARELLMEYWEDEIVDIADDGVNDFVERKKKGGTVVLADHEHIQRSRLRVDTRRWLMSKLAPKKFGQKLDVRAGGPDGGPIRTITKVERVIVDPKGEES